MQVKSFIFFVSSDRAAAVLLASKANELRNSLPVSGRFSRRLIRLFVNVFFTHRSMAPSRSTGKFEGREGKEFEQPGNAGWIISSGMVFTSTEAIGYSCKGA